MTKKKDYVTETFKKKPKPKVSSKASVKIGNKEYIVLDFFGIVKKMDLYEAKLKSFGCIRRSIKEVCKGGLFIEAYTITSWYVPINKIDKFQGVETR